MVADIQKIHKNISDLMIKVILFRILVSVDLLRFSSSFRHLTALLDHKHEHFWNGFLPKTTLYDHLGNVFLIILQSGIFLERKFAHELF